MVGAPVGELPHIYATVELWEISHSFNHEWKSVGDFPYGKKDELWELFFSPIWEISHSFRGCFHIGSYVIFFCGRSPTNFKSLTTKTVGDLPQFFCGVIVQQ
jgi:hypothetical protein